jgi:glycosyltransferase involved in cell wall biosynthesis
LATRGHEVHIITNAKEVQPPFRMHMRTEDWSLCEARCDSGSVTVHWTDPVDQSQIYIPMASPFVSKLAGIAARVHSETCFDVIYSQYLEPYGVAAYLAAQITGVPHVVRMAGSDAGGLWHHPQLEALYDHVLRSAKFVVATGEVAQRAVERGVSPERIVFGGGFIVPDNLFTPDGQTLDLMSLRAELEEDPDVGDDMWGEFVGDKPHFGIYGKLGENKGSFALLDAMNRLKEWGLDVGLVALAHGHTADENRFRDRVRKLGLADRILQIPFLPHWRVPEFLRSCLAVCCLEQNFPIRFHSPIIALEVLLCGTCLVATREVTRKLPDYDRLIHGYGFVAIEDVNDVEMLSMQLAAIARDPKPARAVGMRGRRFARELHQGNIFPESLEDVLLAAAGRQTIAPVTVAPGRAATEPSENFIPLTVLAEAKLAEAGHPRTDRGTTDGSTINLVRARDVLAALKQAIGSGRKDFEPLAAGVRVEIAIAETELEAGDCCTAKVRDFQFRLRVRRWAVDQGDFAKLVPVHDPYLRLIEFDFDVSDFIEVRTIADVPRTVTPRRSFLVAFKSDERRPPLVIDETAAAIINLSDGTRTVSEIAKEIALKDEDSIRWIEELLLCGLVSLTDER